MSVSKGPCKSSKYSSPELHIRMKSGASAGLLDFFSNNAESSDRNPWEANKLEVEKVASRGRSMQMA